MRGTYKLKQAKQISYVAIFALLLPACAMLPQTAEDLPGKQAAPVIEAKAETARPEIIEPVACIPEQPVIKEVIKYVEKQCPTKPKAEVLAKKSNNKENEKLIVGRVEYVSLDGNGIAIKARIDTGANTSSLNALDLSEFERDGKKWVRFAVMNPADQQKMYFEKKVVRYVRIKQALADYQRRPVIKMPVQLGSVNETVELTLSDRSDYLYQVLIGRNYLLDRLIVDVSQKYTTKIQAH